MRKITTVLLLAFAPVAGFAASGQQQLDHANTDPSNIASLQRGAKYYVNYCLGCHSLQYVRYDRLGEDLGLSENQVMDNLMFTADKPNETMDIAMPADDASRWFGNTPPDLSLSARSRGTDWIYTYLRTFYVDESRPLGVNNLVLSNASMPHALAELQGYQRALFEEYVDEEGNAKQRFLGFEQGTEGELSAEEYDRVVRDIVSFLEYVSEPVQLERRNLGIGVIAFLLVFFLFAYFLKREYWKDIH
ncbi:MAG: cytochrome c1 [Gammaproteobacteria bacterium]|nr:cytochrome c1 [Gammaproteobacteria bacterium]